MDNVGIAFLLTLIAGLSTGVGSCLSFFAKRSNIRFLSISLGFSAGVMIYVSMMEILPEAIDTLSVIHGDKTGNLYGILAFFFGMLLITIIDKLVPENENPHNVTKPSDEKTQTVVKKDKLMRTGVLTAIAIAVHNFPEGLATFISALQEPKVAIPIVFAIAIHNIPEGISVSVPIYYATGSKRKAFIYSFVSGLSEPLGAIIGYLILMPILNETIQSIIFAMVGGIMIFISFDELLPAAREYGEHHLSIYGLVSGMAIMAISLYAFI